MGVKMLNKAEGYIYRTTSESWRLSLEFQYQLVVTSWLCNHSYRTVNELKHRAPRRIKILLSDTPFPNSTKVFLHESLDEKRTHIIIIQDATNTWKFEACCRLGIMHLFPDIHNLLRKGTEKFYLKAEVYK
jgi:hypothetical protein